jgi:hypothetical protein
MHFIHLIVIQMKILLVLSDLIVLFVYNEWYFAFHALFLCCDMKYLQTSENEMKL